MFFTFSLYALTYEPEGPKCRTCAQKRRLGIKMDSTFFFGAFFVHAFGLYKTLTFDPEAGSLSYTLMSPMVQSAVPVHKIASTAP